MAYRVNLTDRVLRELDDIHAEINVVGSAGAARWFSRMEDTIQLLASSPRMGKPAREASGVREIIYGKKPHLYRILYEVDESTESVDVLSIWHGRRESPTLKRIKEVE
jgi:plasmid stabilization system protein ParE